MSCLACESLVFFFIYYLAAHRDLHVRTPPYPTRRSSDLHFSSPQPRRRHRSCCVHERQANNKQRPTLASRRGASAPARNATSRRVAPTPLLDRKSTRLNSSY